MIPVEIQYERDGGEIEAGPVIDELASDLGQAMELARHYVDEHIPDHLVAGAEDGDDRYYVTAVRRGA